LPAPQLGITHIPFYSPPRPGRIERVLGTLQVRLAQDLGLAGITTMEAANRFLADRRRRGWHRVPSRTSIAHAAEARSARAGARLGR